MSHGGHNISTASGRQMLDLVPRTSSQGRVQFYDVTGRRFRGPELRDPSNWQDIVMMKPGTVPVSAEDGYFMNWTISHRMRAMYASTYMGCTGLDDPLLPPGRYSAMVTLYSMQSQTTKGWAEVKAMTVQDGVYQVIQEVILGTRTGTVMRLPERMDLLRGKAHQPSSGGVNNPVKATELSEAFCAYDDSGRGAGERSEGSRTRDESPAFPPPVKQRSPIRNNSPRYHNEVNTAKDQPRFRPGPSLEPSFLQRRRESSSHSEPFTRYSERGQGLNHPRQSQQREAGRFPRGLLPSSRASSARRTPPHHQRQNKYGHRGPMTSYGCYDKEPWRRQYNGCGGI